MTDRTLSHKSQCFRALQQHGLILESDPVLPSVAGIVAGESIRGSWWGHPRSHEIFAVLNSLAERPDVLLVKLIRGKVTLVHQSLWPALFGVAVAREPWQLNSLPPATMGLLDQIDARGELHPPTPRDRATTRAIHALETRLLIHTTQTHTESGRHERLLMSWDHWRIAASFNTTPIPVDAAKAQLEEAALHISATNLLPWQR